MYRCQCSSQRSVRPASSGLISDLTDEVCLAEDLIPWLEPGHVLAHVLDLPGNVSSRHVVLRPAQAGSHESQDARAAAHDVPHIWVDGGSPNSHEHLVGPDHGRVDVSHLEQVGCSVAVLHHRSHAGDRTRTWRPAAGVGFEPTNGLPLRAFKARAIGH